MASMPLPNSAIEHQCLLTLVSNTFEPRFQPPVLLMTENQKVWNNFQLHLSMVVSDSCRMYPGKAHRAFRDCHLFPMFYASPFGWDCWEWASILKLSLHISSCYLLWRQRQSHCHYPSCHWSSDLCYCLKLVILPTWLTLMQCIWWRIARWGLAVQLTVCSTLFWLHPDLLRSLGMLQCSNSLKTGQTAKLYGVQRRFQA